MGYVCVCVTSKNGLGETNKNEVQESLCVRPPIIMDLHVPGTYGRCEPRSVHKISFCSRDGNESHDWISRCSVAMIRSRSLVPVLVLVKVNNKLTILWGS